MSPCILFFDELDSLAPARGRSSDSGGVMDRVVSQVLTEMDMLDASNESSEECNEPNAALNIGVIVMGATNRPDLLDKSLLRPGRFDVKIYLSSCTDIAMRTQILRTVTRKFIVSRDTDLESIAQKLPPNVTGADITAMASNAQTLAMRRVLESLYKECLGSEGKIKSLGTLQWLRLQE